MRYVLPELKLHSLFHTDLGEKESIIDFQMKYSNDYTINSSNIIMHILTLKKDKLPPSLSTEFLEHKVLSMLLI